MLASLWSDLEYDQSTHSVLPDFRKLQAQKIGDHIQISFSQNNLFGVNFKFTWSKSIAAFFEVLNKSQPLRNPYLWHCKIYLNQRYEANKYTIQQKHVYVHLLFKTESM